MMKRAFTIVELLIVVVIIGILASITITSFSSVTTRANTASIQSDLINAKKQIMMFQIQNGAYPTLINDCPSPAAANICLKASNNATYSYSVNNTATPATFGLTETLGTLAYSITDSTTPTAGALYPIVTGGTLTSDATYYYRTFTTNGTLSVTYGSITADVLLVAGSGGGGGSDTAWGYGGQNGGTAGWCEGSATLSASTSISVGSAGVGGPVNQMNVNGTSGGNSTLSTLVATGGTGGLSSDNGGVAHQYSGTAAAASGSGSGGSYFGAGAITGSFVAFPVTSSPGGGAGGGGTNAGSNGGQGQVIIRYTRTQVGG